MPPHSSVFSLSVVFCIFCFSFSVGCLSFAFGGYRGSFSPIVGVIRGHFPSLSIEAFRGDEFEGIQKLLLVEDVSPVAFVFSLLFSGVTDLGEFKGFCS